MRAKLFFACVVSVFLVASVAAQGAVPNPGHRISELQTCGEGKILKVVSGSWACVDAGTGGSSLWTASGSNIYYSGGNVSIGKSSAGARLDVKFSSFNEGGGLRLSKHSSGDYWDARIESADSKLVWKSGDGSDNVLVLSNNGNVGIGTNSPSGKLHVDGDIRVTGGGRILGSQMGLGTVNPVEVLNVVGNAEVSGNVRASGFCIGSGSCITSWSSGGGGVSGSGANGHIAFWTGTSALSSNNNLFWDNTNSRLGIGITNPATKLEVRDSSDVTVRVVKSTHGALDLTRTDNTAIVSSISTTDNKNNLALRTNGLDRIYISSDGNVGIGTDNPYGKLHITGNIILTAGNSDTDTKWSVMGTNNAFAIRDTTAGEDRLWISKSNGNVGIGTSSPDHALEIDTVSHNQALKVSTQGNEKLVITSQGSYFETQIYLNGRLALNGNTYLRLHRNDEPPGTCGAILSGAIYFDTNHGDSYGEFQMPCVCTKQGSDGWKWRAMDNMAVECK